MPTASGVSAQGSGQRRRLRRRRPELLLNQNFIVSLELFKGDTAFKPRDREFRVTGVFNINFLDVKENGVVNVDVREGTRPHRDLRQPAGVLPRVPPGRPDPQLRLRLDRGPASRASPATSAASSSVTTRWASASSATSAPTATSSTSPTSGRSRRTRTAGSTGCSRRAARTSRSPTTSARTSSCRATRCRLASTTCTTTATRTIDKNGFVVRPADRRHPRSTHIIDAVYLGWTGDGHIGPLNVTHAFYQVLGRDSRNPISAAGTEINAQMAALELSMDFDWVRPKFTFFWASGDDKPLDSRSRGFDSILDNPNFAGGGFSYWVRQGIPLTDHEPGARRAEQPRARAAQQQDRGPAELREPRPLPVRPRRRLRGHAEDQGALQGQLSPLPPDRGALGCCSSRTGSGTTWAGT